MEKIQKQRLRTAAIFVVGILLGWLIFGGGGSNDDKHSQDSETSAETIWTCSMHPQIQQPEPGACPLCGMDLIPLEADENDGDPRVFVMSENAMRLANVSTMVVSKGDIERSISLSGKVEVDERSTYSQTTHIPGRIEQLRINFTGERVSRGQTLAQIYSPELVTAQEELLQAYRIRESQPDLFEASKAKLRNWRISEAQINQIISNQRPLQQFSIQADVSGVVTSKNVSLGDYVERGMPLYEITDLNKVWVLFDIYESQMAWVREDSEVTFTVRSLPGETFEGKISFVDPLLGSQTRVSNARVEVDNKDGRLKPGMLVSGMVQTPAGANVENQIVIPKSAVLWTGKRAIVYVKKGRGFSLRQIELGSSLGDSYIVTEGLQEGEEVVINGAFTIDAAVQLSGRPSMMSPEGGDVSTGHDHGERVSVETFYALEKVEISEEAEKALQQLFKEYFSLKENLADDDFEKAKESGKRLKDVFGKINMKLFEGKSHEAWMAFETQMKSGLEKATAVSDMEGLRTHFQQISNAIIQLTKQTEPLSETIYLQYCPMADNDRGAYWLSLEEQIKNPYFGSMMLRCGEVKDIIK